MYFFNSLGIISIFTSSFLSSMSSFLQLQWAASLNFPVTWQRSLTFHLQWAFHKFNKCYLIEIVVLLFYSFSFMIKFVKMFFHYFLAVFIFFKNFFNKFISSIFTSVSNNWLTKFIINTNKFISKTTRNVNLIFFEQKPS